MTNQEVQFIAKQTMDYIKNVITPGMKLTQVRKMCEEKMLELGADSFWYWDIGAFIFSGDETTKSVSGKEYETADKYIEENDIVTIDLSPQRNHIWETMPEQSSLKKAKSLNHWMLFKMRNGEKVWLWSRCFIRNS